MKNRRFFFSIVAVIVVLGVFFFVFFGSVKPRFQSAVKPAGEVGIAAVARVVSVDPVVDSVVCVV